MNRPIKDIFKEFIFYRSQIELPVEELKRKFQSYSDGVVLYGAGSSGIALLKSLHKVGIKPICFCDGASNKWGKLCMGLPIFSPEQLIENVGRDILVIVCINTDGRLYCRSFEQALRQNGHHGVHQHLHDVGCETVIDYAELRSCFSLFLGDDTGNLPCCPDVEMMIEHQDEIEEAYYMFADETSRDTYFNILSFRLFGKSKEIITIPQKEQYFPNDLFSLTSDERFVDCGAFNGLTLKTLLEKTQGRISKYYGIEPDYINYDKLQDFILKLPFSIKSRMESICAAAWDETGEKNLSLLEGPGSYLAEYGEVVVPTISIDGMLDGRLITAIKMNIEGSEMHALRGAEKSITRWLPKLMIAGYHKTWDFWQIPCFINQAGQGAYHLALKSYMHQLSFVFYAIPIGG